MTGTAMSAVLRRFIAMLAVLACAATSAAAQVVHDVDTLRITVSAGSRAAATLPALTRGVEVITREQIALLPAYTLHDVLGHAFGVDMLPRSPAQGNVAIQGSSFEQVLVLVNGLRVNDTQTGHFHLSLAVPLQDIERIEILRGPASSLHGSDAVGGIINVVTRRASAGGAHARLDAGSFGTVGLALGGAAAGSALRGRVTGEIRRSDGHRRPGTDYLMAQGRAAAEADLAGTTIIAELAFAARNFGARNFYTSPGADFDEYEETRTLTGMLALEPVGAGRLRLEPRLSMRRHDDDFVLFRTNPAFYRNTHTSWRLGGDLTARSVLRGDLRIAFGAEIFEDRLTSSSLGDRREWRGALFTEAAGGREGRAVFSAGLRGDVHSVFGAFVAPSVSGAVWTLPALRLRGSAGRAFRAPNWTERHYEDPANVGNPDLEPERAWSVEIGAEFTPRQGLRIEASTFRRQTSQLIDWARPAEAQDAVWQALNVSSARFRGLELGAEAGLSPGTRATLRCTMTSVNAETGADHASKYALRPLTRTASFGLAQVLPGRFEIAGRLRHARRAGDETAYNTVDLRMTWMASERLSLFLDGTNLTGTEHLDVARLPAPGRALHVGMGWR